MARFSVFIVLFILLVLPGQTLSAQIQAFNPIILYDVGGRDDQSFNEAAYRGAELFKTETELDYTDHVPQSHDTFEQDLESFVHEGHNPIIAIGLNYQTALSKVAGKYPDTNFVIIDAIVDLPNVQSITFKEQEGSFLVGVLATLASKTKTIGFIGGMNIPIIRRFADGFSQGAHYANPNIKIVKSFVGNTSDAWVNDEKAKSLAKAQYDYGVDIIFSPAGPAGLGVIEAARENEKLAVGVDINQNHIAPGYVLTSMLKRIDIAVRDSLIATSEGNFASGQLVFGLKENGVGLSMDDNNKPLITQTMMEALENAQSAIISGEIEVHIDKDRNQE